jgi:hypothetical protein
MPIWDYKWPSFWPTPKRSNNIIHAGGNIVVMFLAFFSFLLGNATFVLCTCIIQRTLKHKAWFQDTTLCANQVGKKQKSKEGELKIHMFQTQSLTLLWVENYSLAQLGWYEFEIDALRTVLHLHNFLDSTQGTPVVSPSWLYFGFFFNWIFHWVTCF